MSLLLVLMSWFAGAEVATYGSVDLTGLARDSWPYNPAGPSNAMVCNVNGPDGFLSVRACTQPGCGIVRNLKRLAIVMIDTRVRDGHWVFVTGAYRNHSEDGDRLAAPKNLPVRGWVHDGYLCDFLD